jgi:hypothetical protein
MATIPTGNFGQAIARPGPMVSIPRGDPLGDATARTTGIAQGIENDLTSQESQQREAQRRAAASLALIKSSNDLHDAHDEVIRGLSDGTIAADKAVSEFSKRASKVRDATLDGYLPDQRTLMDQHLTQTEGTLQRGLVGAVFKKNQLDTAATIDQFGEQVSREATRLGPQWAADKFGSMVDFSGSSAGMNDAQKAKVKQAFSERVHATFYELAGTAALTKDDANALGGLVSKLQGPDGDPLDPQKRALLTHQLYGWQQHVLAKQQRALNAADDEERRRYNLAVDTFNKATDIALGGGFLSPEFIKQMTTAGQGTAMEAPILGLIAKQKDVAGFASMPSSERLAVLERMRADRANPAVGTDDMGNRVFNAAVNMDAKMRAEAKDNPWAAAQQVGVIKDAPLISAGDPSAAMKIVQDRTALLPLVERWVGEKISPLQPPEVEQVAKMVRQTPPDQAASMLAGFGATLGDAERVAAMAKQLHDKDGSIGLAMMYANAKTTEGRYTAELILRGQQALEDKRVLVDDAKQTGWKGTIATEIRGVYSNPEAESNAIKAAFLITAANYVKGDGTDIDRAVRLATGGIIERNGQKFPLPYGMTESQFDKKLNAVAQSDQVAQQTQGGVVYVGRTPIPLASFYDSLASASLVHAGQGLYNVRAGNMIVTNQDGKRITIKVGP